MIFRNKYGELVEINRFDFKNDTLFFQKIMDSKNPFTKLNNSLQKNTLHTIKTPKTNFSNYIINSTIQKLN
jgi:hypothetical protein